jgi:hypothetical protein
MNMSKLSYFLLSATFLSSAAAGSKRVMTWLCLEFCQESEEQIALNLAQLNAVIIYCTDGDFRDYDY